MKNTKIASGLTELRAGSATHIRRAKATAGHLDELPLEIVDTTDAFADQIEGGELRTVQHRGSSLTHAALNRLGFAVDSTLCPTAKRVVYAAAPLCSLRQQLYGWIGDFQFPEQLQRDRAEGAWLILLTLWNIGRAIFTVLFLAIPWWADITFIWLIFRVTVPYRNATALLARFAFAKAPPTQRPGDMRRIITTIAVAVGLPYGGLLGLAELSPFAYWGVIAQLIIVALFLGLSFLKEARETT